MSQKLLKDKGWLQILKSEFSKNYYKELKHRVDLERKNYIVYPLEEFQFEALNKTPFESIKIVLLGQDPYHGIGQAHGLSFSVQPCVQLPRSLKNIFKELESDLSVPLPSHGNLEKWATQGVLLLNTILTVREKTPKSHHGWGWEIFTDNIIKQLSDRKEHLVFMLWGNDAQCKQNLIDESKHCILKAAHPSPFSASRGFFGCSHFSKANAFLIKNNIQPINWKL
jgi:uracil-DNA glycosylase